jgi:integrase/recombinase XerD
MTDLRKKMIRDLCIKGYSEITCKDYIRNVAYFAKHFNKSPDLFTLEEIYQYQEFLIKTRQISFSYFNQIVCAIKFLYKITLKKNWDIDLIPYKKKRRKPPVVLAKEEILALFEVIESFRDKLMLYAIYSAGLRISEVVNLKPYDIDSKRMVIRIVNDR